MRKRIAVKTLAVALGLTVSSWGLNPIGNIPVPVGPPTPTFDVGMNPTAAQQLLQIIHAVIEAELTYTSVHNQELWHNQFFSNKQAFITWLARAIYSQTVNQYGETSGWNPAMSTGIGSQAAYGNATVAMNPTAPLLAGVLIGDNRMALLATIETQAAAVINSISTIGTARSYIDLNNVAMQSLQSRIADPSAANNGPTQQLQLVANAEAQNMNLSVQNLQVQTGILETVTTIQKDQNDARTAYINIQSGEVLTRMTQPTGASGFGAAFMGHP